MHKSNDIRNSSESLQTNCIDDPAPSRDMQTMLLEVMPDWVTSNEPEAVQFREDIKELINLVDEASSYGTGFNKVISRSVSRNETPSKTPEITKPRLSSSKIFTFNISDSTSIWLAITAVVALLALFAIVYM